MDESTPWEFRRYATLGVVVSLHVALLVILALATRTETVSTAALPAVELIPLPPVHPPRVRATSAPPRHLSVDTLLLVSPPVPNSTSIASSMTGSDGNGSGVDWAAEARRAKLAYEIRDLNPAGNYTRGHAPGEEQWWPRAEHHPGEKFKTSSGDWIVWINSRCYELASSSSRAYSLGGPLPKTICPDETSASQQQ